MRWLTLYARSRQIPVSLATLITSTVLVCALAWDGSAGPGDPRLPVLVIGTGTMAASIGLSGQDLALDRTAAIPWIPRRAAHVLLAGVLIGAVLAAAQTIGEDMAPTGLIARDCAGQMGLAALGATLLGGRYAWSLPFAWLAFSIFAPPPTSVATEAATWLLLPPGTPAGTWTALSLALVGTTTYAIAGPRRFGVRHQ
ncbi:hypothetical protein ABZV80_44190 [Streptomyces sp. NPDC005132]|uniref:hypothetical protein n=1 Tax=Streptomyces sp. NPDC005132 TaxID=3154294 RepID=UPI0033B46DD0